MSTAGFSEYGGEPEWISPHDRPHVLLGTVAGREVIGKRPKPPAFGRSLSWSTLRHRADFRREIAVFRGAARGSFVHLKVPAIVSTDERTYLCLEKVDSVAANGPFPDPVKHRAAAALAEFQTGLRLEEGVLQRAVLALTRAPIYGILRRSLGAVRRALGMRIALRCVVVALKERARQPRLSRRYAIHGDFSRRNTLVGSDGVVHVIDFGDTFYDRRWPLLDILYYVTTDFDGSESIDLTAVHSYLRAVTEYDGGVIMKGINLRAQVRIALLRRVLWRFAAGRMNEGRRRRSAAFLQGVLLDDGEFEGWYRRMFGSLLPELSTAFQKGAVHTSAAAAGH